MTLDELERLVRYAGNARDLDTLTALLRRDWAVRVLDAWRFYSGVRRIVYEQGSGGDDLERVFGYERSTDPAFIGRGPTPDAARHAAALAVFPNLPEAVRAELGECP